MSLIYNCKASGSTGVLWYILSPTSLKSSCAGLKIAWKWSPASVVTTGENGARLTTVGWDLSSDGEQKGGGGGGRKEQQEKEKERRRGGGETRYFSGGLVGGLPEN